MAEPKKRLTSTRSGNRRAHLALVNKKLATCPKCKNAVFSHRVCPNCGYYKNFDLLKLEEKSKAKDARRKAREAETLSKDKTPEKEVKK